MKIYRNKSGFVIVDLEGEKIRPTKRAGDGSIRCQVAGCMHNGVYFLCTDHADPPRR